MKDETIIMDVSDARYRYYNWLRRYCGLGISSATHKCPFYQFMIWGTLVLIASFPFFLWMKFLQYVLFRVLGKIFPKLTIIEDLILGTPLFMSFSLFSVTCLVFSGIKSMSLIGGFFTPTVLWVGWFLYHVYALIPYGILYYIGLLLWWLVTKIAWSIVWLLTAAAWSLVGLWLLYSIGVILAIVLFGWILYRVGVFFFNQKLFEKFIDSICHIQKDMKKNSEIRLKQLKKYRDSTSDERKKEKLCDVEDTTSERKKEKLCVVVEPFQNLLEKYIWFPLESVFRSIIRIAEGFKVLWFMLTETVSNHCPPIEFVSEFDETGYFVINLDGIIIFSVSNDYIYIPSEIILEGFEIKVNQKLQIVGVVTQAKVFKISWTSYRQMKSISFMEYESEK